jgi:hypothetical protein
MRLITRIPRVARVIRIGATGASASGTPAASVVWLIRPTKCGEADEGVEDHDAGARRDQQHGERDEPEAERRDHADDDRRDDGGAQPRVDPAQRTVDGVGPGAVARGGGAGCARLQDDREHGVDHGDRDADDQGVDDRTGALGEELRHRGGRGDEGGQILRPEQHGDGGDDLGDHRR